MKIWSRIWKGYCLANVGKLFEGEIRRFLEAEHAMVYRAYDLQGPRFTSKKKFDFHACSYNGFFVAVECKATRQVAFAFTRVKNHQRDALSKVASTEHGKAYLALNFRDVRGPGKAYLIPWDYWCDFEKRWSKKSIRREEAIGELHQFKLVRITAGWTKTR